MSRLYIVDPGSSLRINNGKLIIKYGNGNITTVPSRTVESIVISTTVQVTSRVIEFCLRENVNIGWVSGRGYWEGGLFNKHSFNINHHIVQLKLFDKVDFKLELAKRIIRAKIHNQLILLKRYRRYRNDVVDESVLEAMDLLEAKVEIAKNINTLLGIEGLAARYYFQALRKIVPEYLNFNNRQKHPAVDIVNALLGYGYSILFNEIFINVINEGLHPYMGFIHSIKRRHPALVSDLMEPFRPILVDSIVMKMCKKILPDSIDCNTNPEGYYLNESMIRDFVAEYEKKMMKNQSYKGNNISYREILPRIVQNYKEVIYKEKLELFNVFSVR